MRVMGRKVRTRWMKTVRQTAAVSDNSASFETDDGGRGETGNLGKTTQQQAVNNAMAGEGEGWFDRYVG